MIRDPSLFHDDCEWEVWPLGCDSKGNINQDLSLQIQLIGSILVQWFIVNGKDVYLRRIDDE